MAIGAHGRYNQSRFKKALAMDTHYIIFKNIMLFAFISYRCRIALSMTTGTKSRNIGREGGRFGIAFAQYTMLSVTILTARSINIAPIG